MTAQSYHIFNLSYDQENIFATKEVNVISLCIVITRESVRPFQRATNCKKVINREKFRTYYLLLRKDRKKNQALIETKEEKNNCKQ